MAHTAARIPPLSRASRRKIRALLDIFLLWDNGPCQICNWDCNETTYLRISSSRFHARNVIRSNNLINCPSIRIQRSLLHSSIRIKPHFLSVHPSIFQLSISLLYLFSYRSITISFQSSYPSDIFIIAFFFIIFPSFISSFIYSSYIIDSLSFVYSIRYE